MNSAVGYQALIEQLDLRVIKHYRQSYIALRGRGYVKIENNHEMHVYPNSHAVKDPKNPIHQLIFALKYDGVNLEILQAVFKKIAAHEIEIAIHQHPGSKYIRVLWFLYEFLTDQTIKAPELGILKHVNVLDADRYFTSKGIKSRRHKVNNNLIGNKEFCPIIRKTKILAAYIDKKYDLKAKALADKYDPKIIARASYYLFTKETLSSYEIEREKPNKNRIAKFINTLQKSTTIEELTKKQLIELQNIIVDPRFQDVDYRKNQNYIGENIDYFPRIHYICPRPENVESLMNGLLEALQLVLHAGIHPVLIAAMISFGFVFIHPFEDGNGRIHRFLIHYILSKQRFTPSGIIFPVSAAMLKKIHEYDKILESLSKPVMNLISDYTLSDDGVLLVKQDTHSYYKYVDYTLCRVPFYMHRRNIA